VEALDPQKVDKKVERGSREGEEGGGFRASEREREGTLLRVSSNILFILIESREVLSIKSIHEGDTANPAPPLLLPRQ
jgi:hypothetical protein